MHLLQALGRASLHTTTQLKGKRKQSTMSNKKREGSTLGKGGLYKKFQIPTLPPKWPRSGLTFHGNLREKNWETKCLEVKNSMQNAYPKTKCKNLKIKYGGDETRSGYVGYVQGNQPNVPCKYYVHRQI